MAFTGATFAAGLGELLGGAFAITRSVLAVISGLEEQSCSGAIGGLSTISISIERQESFSGTLSFAGWSLGFKALLAFFELHSDSNTDCSQPLFTFLDLSLYFDVVSWSTKGLGSRVLTSLDCDAGLESLVFGQGRPQSSAPCDNPDSTSPASD